jgi:hypothetical protein
MIIFYANEGEKCPQILTKNAEQDRRNLAARIY